MAVVVAEVVLMGEISGDVAAASSITIRASSCSRTASEDPGNQQKQSNTAVNLCRCVWPPHAPVPR